ncbi:hypothetical protein ACFHW2_17780 [Actinomadura sp. LOL_016]|uniref:hypothetical protein n=1 Tax=unclassified Actinomadura TaxID=2626254 RepID=UPI003A7F9E90
MNPNQPVWNPSKCKGGKTPSFSGPDVVTELEQHAPQPLFVTMHDADPGNADWDHSFVLTYRVVLSGWTVAVIAHVHIKKEKGVYRQFTGNAYIPGYDNWDCPTPQFVLAQAPAFDPNVHTYDRTKKNTSWTNDAGAVNAFYGGAERYPRPTT